MITRLFRFNEHINSSNFESWFKDSKIVINNVPMILYHGSDSPDIEIFETDKIGYNSGNEGHYGYGIYFTSHENEAKLYGDYIYKCYLKIINPFTSSNEDYIKLKELGWDVGTYEPIKITKESFMIHVSDNIRKFMEIHDVNPDEAWSEVHKNKNDKFNYNIIYDLLIEDEKEYLNYIEEYFIELGIDISLLDVIYDFTYKVPLHYLTETGLYGKELTKDLIKLGYDGVIAGSEYVVFRSNQIKSINNNGSFDANSDNIYE